MLAFKTFKYKYWFCIMVISSSINLTYKEFDDNWYNKQATIKWKILRGDLSLSRYSLLFSFNEAVPNAISHKELCRLRSWFTFAEYSCISHKQTGRLFCAFLMINFLKFCSSLQKSANYYWIFSIALIV